MDFSGRRSKGVGAWVMYVVNRWRPKRFLTTKGLGWTHRPQPNLCVTLTGLQIYAISPRAAPGLAARLTLGFYVSPSGLLPLCGCENVMDADCRMQAWRLKGPAT